MVRQRRPRIARARMSVCPCQISILTHVIVARRACALDQDAREVEEELPVRVHTV
jgi:hypothetical protein